MRIAQLLAVSISLALAVAGCGGSGSAPRPLPPGQVRPLAFVSDRDGDNEVYIMRVDGTGRVNVTNHPGGDDNAPAWSPDRTRIVLSSRPNGHASEEEIYVVNAATGAVTQVTNNSLRDTSPCWSPDGTKIAYAAGGSNNWVIHVVNADGTGDSGPLAGGIDPAWSPDGIKIAYTSTVEWPNDLDIHVMNPNGSGQTNLTNDPDYSWCPAWSPDGTELAFFSCINWSPPFSILKMSSAGGAMQWLHQLIGGADVGNALCWSPDGSKIVFDTWVGNDSQIHTINADGTGHQTLLAEAGIDNDQPDWSR